MTDGHIYQGACPDNHTGPQSRDPQCPACQAMDGVAPSPSAQPAPVPALAPLTGRTHELKTDAHVFSEVTAGRKLFEIRKNDRDFRCGDLLRLRSTRCTGAEMAAGQPLIYTGEEITVRVIGILRGPVYGLAEGWVIMSIAAPAATQPAGEEAIRRAVAALAHYAEYGHIDDDVVALIADLQYPIAARAAQAGDGNAKGGA